jgi:hypothetical protein
LALADVISWKTIFLNDRNSERWGVKSQKSANRGASRPTSYNRDIGAAFVDGLVISSSESRCSISVAYRIATLQNETYTDWYSK